MLEWERGRQLKEFGGITFTYDAGGVRQSKTANGVTTSYFTEGNRIHREERSDGKTLLYAYDASGLASITYNGTLYFVQKNFQGDIVALVDKNGNVVAKYVYDAWGNGKVCNASGTENTSSSFIGNINPFRYRGYYYDVETGLYYLQTRYYEPRAGRFLNADSVDYIAPDIIGGLNLYAYCNNNPVMYSDPEGTAWWHILAGVLAVVGVVLVAGAVTALTMGVGTTVMAASMTGAVIHGAAVGTLIGAGTGAVAGGLIGGAVSGWTAEGILTGVGIGFGGGAILGAVIGGVAGGITYSPTGLSRSSIKNGVRTTLNDPNKMHHIMQPKHNLPNSVNKVGKIMQKTLTRGTYTPYKSISSVVWRDYQVTYNIVNDVIKISNMWFLL